MLKKINRTCADCALKNECEHRRNYSNEGIRATKRKFNQNLKIIGGDTESCEGEPITFQLYDLENNGIIRFVDGKNIFDKFLDELREYKLGHGIKTALIWMHNLEFDLSMLLFPIVDLFAGTDFRLCGLDCNLCKKKDSRFCGWMRDSHAIAHRCRIDVKCNKVFFACITFYNEDNKLVRRFYIRDTFAFMKGSLEYICDELKLGAKIKKPPLLGKKKYTDKDDYFIYYAINDARLAYLLGEYLLEFNREFDVPVACSAPNLAQKVFTKHFFPKGITTWMPSKSVWDACTLSYHGGKNFFNLPHASEVKNVFELDVNSMYPHAMISMLPWTAGQFEEVYEVDYERMGVYCITGYAKECEYPIIPNHEFKYFKGERFERIWVGCYELIEALKCNEIELESVYGYVFVPDEKAVNPFKDYVDFFYKKKKESKDSKRAFVKVLLNALYGKFCQSTCCNGGIDSFSDITRNEEGEITEVSINPVHHFWRAGGLCNMFISTMITSFARAKLHHYEEKYASLDSSTDSIKTLKPPDPADIGDEIGQLSIKAFGHKAYLIRNKAYVFFDEEGRFETEDERGNMIPIHAARHGFHGSFADLVRLFEEKKTKYDYSRMVKLKESRISIKDLKPFAMHDFTDMAFNVEYAKDVSPGFSDDQREEEKAE